MNPSTPSANAIESHIAQDIGHCESLLELLEKEREALKSRDAEQLEIIIKDKSTHLIELERNAKLRSQWAGATPQTTPTSSPPDSLADRWTILLSSHSDHVNEQWQQFRRLIEQCQSENEINGRLLARNQQVFSRLLAILRGQNESMDLYNPKGNQANHSGRQFLGEA